MAMYSSNGVQYSINVQKTLASSGEGAVIEARTPNASQFGWTDNDLSGVKDLAVWVNTAQEAATSAQANADYLEASVTFINDSRTESQNILSQVKASQTAVADTLVQITAKANQVASDRAATKALRDEVKVMYDEIKAIYDASRPVE